MAQYAVVGKPLPRIDGRPKVTGETVYAADMKLPRMLHARLVCSPCAHARIVRIDASRARAYPGVAAVLTGRDLPTYNANPTSRRHVTLPRDEVLFYGQPVAVVLAEDATTAEEARELVEVEYQELPAVVDPLAAMAEDAPLARQPLTDIDRSEEKGHITIDAAAEEAEGKLSNISSQIRFARGEVEKGFAEADVVVERTWRSGMVHQGYIEPHVTIADYDATGDLTIWSSTQAPFYVRDEVSSVLGISENKIRVIATEVGGGFGGKNFLEQMLAAALALQVRRPVKLLFSRKEDLLAAMPAPQVIVHLKTGMKRDGTLVALQARLIYDSGAYPGAPMVQGCMYIGGYYRCPNLEIQGYEVLTNKVSVGALRAPGTHNATWALECHMDIMARELGLDPLEVRLKNAVGPGDPLPSGAPYPSIGLRQCLERVAESPIWQERRQVKKEGALPRGVGLAVGGWQGGLQPASAIVALNGDGTINVTVGASDITGVRTSFAQIVAEELRLPMEKISVVTGDTRTAPYAGMSAGSKIIFTVGRAVKQAAEDARLQILETAAERLEADSSDLELVEGRVQVKGDPERAVTLGQIGQMTTAFAARYAPVVGRGAIAARKSAPGFTAQVAEVEVDPDTGEVTVLRYAIAQDAGLAINPLSVEGQMQGGTTQGLGIALSEEMVFDDQGRLLNPNLLDYRLPTARDVPPRIETLIVEVPSDDGPYGARGVGEPSIIAGAATIANAVADAIGVRVDTIPITPERILRALGKVND